LLNQKAAKRAASNFCALGAKLRGDPENSAGDSSFPDQCTTVGMGGVTKARDALYLFSKALSRAVSSGGKSL
jgi:hypothetical protein